MSDLVVAVESGVLRGVTEAGVRRWRNVPYAVAERFAAPRRPDPWAGERDAQMPGPSCPQMYGNNAKRAFTKGPDFDENCLSLNVFVPDGGADIGAKPVYVWIHGGAFVAGNGSSYDGSWMARLCDVIVVTINYRVGVLGWVNFGDVLGIPDIPSNLGLRDQIAALEWVQRNIAAFGGDPKRVTIGGQSAGSMSVSLLLHCRVAWPLFQQAIMQSGAVSLIHSKEMSEQVARRYAEILGLNQSSLATLRDLDLVQLFEAQGQVGSEYVHTIPAAPWFDGDLLPATLADCHAAGAAPVPLLAGAARDEIRLFDIMPGDILPSKWDDLEKMLTQHLGADHAARILATYPRTKQGRVALASDLTFLQPTRNFAERHSAHSPTWFYRFDYAHPIAGATHGLDLTVTWPMSGLRAALARGGPMRGKRAAMGERMVRHYGAFVRGGEPGGDWPRYTPEDRMVKLFNLSDALVPNPEAARHAAWAGADVGPGIT